MIKLSLAQSIESTFDVDDEGWRVAANNGAYHFGKNPGPEYFSTGGNPGGHIQYEDNIAGAYYAIAPGKFLGDISLYNYGQIIFDVRAVSGELTPATIRHEFGTVIISGPNGTAILDIIPGMPGSTFSAVSIALVDSVWGKTAEEWNLILSNVTDISIILEYSISWAGDDRIAFDNFIITQPVLCGIENQCINDKVLICHMPSNDPSKALTLCVSKSAAENHLAHGTDICGPCGGSSNKYGVENYVEISGISSPDAQEGISVYPNPFSDHVLIKIGHFHEFEYDKTEIRICDDLGREVFFSSGLTEGSNDIKLEKLEKGIYTYHIINDQITIKSGTLIRKE
jgi:hypothetical protein